MSYDTINFIEFQRDEEYITDIAVKYKDIDLNQPDEVLKKKVAEIREEILSEDHPYLRALLSAPPNPKNPSSM